MLCSIAQLENLPKFSVAGFNSMLELNLFRRTCHNVCKIKLKLLRLSAEIPTVSKLIL